VQAKLLVPTGLISPRHPSLGYAWQPSKDSGDVPSRHLAKKCCLFGVCASGYAGVSVQIRKAFRASETAEHTKALLFPGKHLNTDFERRRKTASESRSFACQLGLFRGPWPSTPMWRSCLGSMGAKAYFVLRKGKRKETHCLSRGLSISKAAVQRSFVHSTRIFHFPGSLAYTYARSRRNTKYGASPSWPRIADSDPVASHGHISPR
jgi:hypothetical protein